MRRKLQSSFCGPDFLDCLSHLYKGEQCSRWREDLNDWPRLRYIVNAFTRMRFCEENGTLDLFNKTAHSYRTNKDYDLGLNGLHWRNGSYLGIGQLLKDAAQIPHYVALDTGCAWGHSLTAYRLEDQHCFSFPCQVQV